jgi:hypothetical protein
MILFLLGCFVGVLVGLLVGGLCAVRNLEYPRVRDRFDEVREHAWLN